MVEPQGSRCFWPRGSAREVMVELARVPVISLPVMGMGGMVESKDSHPSTRHKAWEWEVEPQGSLLSTG